jgi:hypothetical protein
VNPAIEALRREGLDGILDRIVEAYYAARPAPAGGVSDKVRESARTARAGRLQVSWNDARTAVGIFAGGEPTPLQPLLDRLRGHKDALMLAALAIEEAICVVESNPGEISSQPMPNGRGVAPRRVWPD